MLRMELLLEYRRSIWKLQTYVEIQGDRNWRFHSKSYPDMQVRVQVRWGSSIKVQLNLPILIAITDNIWILWFKAFTLLSGFIGTLSPCIRISFMFTHTHTDIKRDSKTKCTKWIKNSSSTSKWGSFESWVSV